MDVLTAKEDAFEQFEKKIKTTRAGVCSLPMAMSYLKFSKELVIELLDGSAEFFKEYCDCVYGEKFNEAQWNYVKYFKNLFTMK